MMPFASPMFSPSAFSTGGGTPGVGQMKGLTKLSRTSTYHATWNAWNDFPWQVEDYDNLGAFSMTNPSEIIVPAGINWMRATLLGSNNGNPVLMRLGNASVDYCGDFRSDIAGVADAATHTICSGWVIVTPGDTLKWRYFGYNAGNTYGSAAGGYGQCTFEWVDAVATLHS